MNKIRKYLIHLLGGVTKEESHEDVIYYSKTARADAIQQFKRKMTSCYGLPADEWCKTVYGYACEVHDQAEKELAEFSKTNYDLETEASDERN